MARITLSCIRKALMTGLLLECPRCGVGALFDGFFQMRPQCSYCQLKFEREPGFFVGAIYINYAFTIAIAVPGFFLLDLYPGLSLSQQLVLWGAFAVLFPVLFFRHSRSLWLSLAYLLDPDEEGRLRLVTK